MLHSGSTLCTCGDDTSEKDPLFCLFFLFIHSPCIAHLFKLLMGKPCFVRMQITLCFLMATVWNSTVVGFASAYLLGLSVNQPGCWACLNTSDAGRCLEFPPRRSKPRFAEISHEFSAPCFKICEWKV